MGVYIPNRELPRHCFGCSTKIDPDNRRCNIDGHLFKETLSKISSRRDEACTLVHVPPHGRLGDLDALIEKVIAKYLEHERNGELVFAAAEIKQDIADLISIAPTIIQA